MSDAIEAWRGFWSTATYISATLLGLLFVAIVLNARDSVGGGRTILRALAYRALSAFATVVLIGLLVQMPILPPRRLGATIAVLALLIIIRASWPMTTATLSDTTGRVLGFHWTQLAPWICYVMVLWAGVKLMRGGAHSVDWLAIGAFMLLISGAAVSLEFLRRIPA